MVESNAPFGWKTGSQASSLSRRRVDFHLPWLLLLFMSDVVMSRVTGNWSGQYQARLTRWVGAGGSPTSSPSSLQLE